MYIGPEFSSPEVQGFENNDEFEDIPDSIALFSKTNRNQSFNNEKFENIVDDSKIILELENKYDIESISIIKDLRRRKSEKSAIIPKNDYDDNRIKNKTDIELSANRIIVDTDISMHMSSKISSKKDLLNQTFRGPNSSLLSSPKSSLPSRVHIEKLKPVMPSHNPFASKIQGKCIFDICIYTYVYLYV
jgi:hypothetical protein